MTVPATIATWFVADDAEEATFFPQVGSRSDSSSAKKIYWRCVVCFFASSIGVNPDARHVFYTNTTLPTVDGVAIGPLFERWGIEVVHQPVTYRLPRGTVREWGNQFYVFDVMSDHVERGGASPLILLDSDCVWLRPASALLDEIDRHGALTYELGYDAYAKGGDINGQTREGMAKFVAMHGGKDVGEVPYCGGELYAATADMNRSLVERAKQLWPDVLAQGSDAPREEAHLLSVLYALEEIAIGTANPFISRMWTTFHHNTLRPEDRDLAIWHLPSEKRTGFADLYRQIVRTGPADPRTQAEIMGLTPSRYARLMGYPRRHPAKFARDLALKLGEKAGLKV